MVFNRFTEMRTSPHSVLEQFHHSKRNLQRSPPSPPSSTYKRYHMIFVFLCLTYFTQYDKLQVHPCCCRWHYFVLFYGLVIFHCIYVPHLLYPFLCQWTFRLLPCPGSCKQCGNEHWGACIFSNYGFLPIHAQEWDCWIIWQLYFQSFKEPPYCSPQWLYQFTFPPTVQEGSLFSTPSLAFIISRFFDDGHSDRCEMISHCSFDLHFSNDNDV